MNTLLQIISSMYAISGKPGNTTMYLHAGHSVVFPKRVFVFVYYVFQECILLPHGDMV